MTLDKSSEISQPTLATLRSAFARSCKVLGLRQETCVGLTLLLNSRSELAAMLLTMLEAEDKGGKMGTTEVVLAAEEIHEKYLKIQARNSQGM